MHEVALFITCLTDQFYPQVGIAVTKVLEHFGCRVTFPKTQTCCGQPFFNNGYVDEARELARKFVRDFERAPLIVTPSASCCAMVRQHFAELLEDEPAYEKSLWTIVDRTYEFGEFCEKVLKLDFSTLKLPSLRSVTYHYTCHSRGLGISEQPINQLRQIGNLEYRPMEKTDQCCGFGGTFATKYPAISGAIVEDKVQCIQASGAQTTLCNDAGCTMNISGMCHRKALPMRFQHLAEIMAEALGIDTNQW